MWDLSSLTRNSTHSLCIGKGSLNHQTSREVPGHLRFLMCPCKNPGELSSQQWVWKPKAQGKDLGLSYVLGAVDL